jgi:hypothetical protein
VFSTLKDNQQEAVVHSFFPPPRRQQFLARALWHAFAICIILIIVARALQRSSTDFGWAGWPQTLRLRIRTDQIGSVKG